MTPPSSPLPDEEADLLAAEYALGVLEGADRARAQVLANEDPDFAARVAIWQTQLAPLTDEVAPLPAPNLLPQIESRLFGAPLRGNSRRRITLRLPKFQRPQGWLAGLLGTGVMAALSVVVVALLLQFGQIGTNGPPYGPPVQSALLLAKGSNVAFLARLEGADLMLTQTKGGAPAAGRSYELWLIDGDKAPVSLGLLDHALSLPAPIAAKGYVLAVTDEPFGGGPGGVPTGAIIAAGAFSDL